MLELLEDGRLADTAGAEKPQAVAIAVKNAGNELSASIEFFSTDPLADDVGSNRRPLEPLGLADALDIGQGETSSLFLVQLVDQCRANSLGQVRLTVRSP